MKVASKNLEKVRKTAVLSFFWALVRKLKASVREGDHAGFYRRLKTMNLEGSEATTRSSSKTSTAVC